MRFEAVDFKPEVVKPLTGAAYFETEPFGCLTACYHFTPAVYPRLVEFLHFDIQSTGQKSHRVNIHRGPSRCFVLIRQSDSPGPCQF